MNESELPSCDVTEPGPVADEYRDDRVVTDFTVGPAGVGPAASITPANLDELIAEQPPADWLV